MMTPDYRIVNVSTGKELTERLRPFVNSISLTESVDSATDTLSLSLSGEGVSRFPVSGTHLRIFLGYRESGLANMGVYKVDTKVLSGMPLVLAIKCGASDFNAPYKVQKNRHWDNQRLGDILKTIAAENQLELLTDMAQEPVRYLEQNSESDMALVSRLAKEYGAYGTIKAGKLVFKSPKTEHTVALNSTDLLNFRLQWLDKPHYDQVVAYWHDVNTNNSHMEIWDGENWQVQKQGKTYTLKQTFSARHLAQQAAKTKWLMLRKMTQAAQLTLPGRTDLVSKMGVKLLGIMPELENTTLNIQKVTHTLNGSGYKVAIECSA